MTTHPIQWHAPAPLWARFGATPEAAVTAPDQFRPAILRFTSDDFMDQMIGTLARDPAHLGNLLARPETWRTPPAAVEIDLVERVAVPRTAQAAARSRALARLKSAVTSVGASADVTEQAQRRTLPLKLYQPAHQRYYLVSGSLVCGIAGLPERAVTQGGAEQVNFVLRRLLPAAPDGSTDGPLSEFAFVRDLQGPRWQRVAEGEDARQLAPGEELLPLFPLAYRDEARLARTLWTGLIPVGRREEYLGATIDRTAVPLTIGQRQSLHPPAVPPPAASVTARMTQFKFEVAEPWKNLVRAGYSAHDSLAETQVPGLEGKVSDEDRRKRAFALNLQWQMQSWLILLDFADYLAAYLPDLWAAIDTGVGVSSLSTRRKQVYDWLGTAQMNAALVEALQNPTGNVELRPPKANMREALKAIRAFRNGLEGSELLYGVATKDSPDWPDFHFLLTGLTGLTANPNTSFIPAGAHTALAGLAAPQAGEAEPDPVAGDEAPADEQARQAAEQLDRLTALVVRALESKPETDAPPLPFALQLRNALKSTGGDAGWFVVRFVYLRRDCGPLQPPTLSAPTQRFQLANFFDPDAPARPIRITLPQDTTPAGIRKHNKNTAFVISDVLCGQIQRAKGLGLGDLVRSVLPWPLHKDLDVGDGGACSSGGGINVGMICSLSIPIITICALILLMIIVSLLDFIFRWLPYFIICLPVPGLKGKKVEGA